MAFRDNSVLISTANAVAVEAGNGDTVYTEAADGATTFVIADGAVGDDTFLNFGSDDSLLTAKKIFDGNNDGFIAFGPNGVLDVDRFGGGDSRAGEDQLQLVGTSEDVTEIRYLGSKGGNFAYAESATLRNLFNTFGQENVVEGTVADNEIDLSNGANVLLHDNGLGLNLGSDTVTGFGSDDLFVTTSQLFDRTGNNVVTFAGNDVLDTSGAEGPLPSDPSTGPGGQVDFAGIDGLAYLGTNEIEGVTYYYYGTADTTVNPFTAA